MQISVFVIPNLLTADFSVGRVDHSSMNEQTLMEILVEHLDGKGGFQTSNGEFRNLTEWDGLNFHANGKVNNINFDYDDYDYGDDEYVDTRGGRIDLQWIPPMTTAFSISNLLLSGTVETSELPRELSSLGISDNYFTGTFDMKSLPKSVKVLSLSDNNFEGSLDLRAELPNLHHLDASNNQFSGNLDFTHLSISLRTLILRNNHFGGSIDLTELSADIGFFDISQNAFGQERLVIGNGAAQIRTLRIGQKQFGEIVDEDGNLIYDS